MRSDRNQAGDGTALRPRAIGAALITGGSQGLGRALAGALAATGTRVVLVAREPGPLAAAVAELRARGHQAHGIAADVGARDSTAALVGQATALVGRLDLLVNNASTLGAVPLRLLLDTDCEELERVLQINVVAPFRLTKAWAGALLLSGDAGLVLNISSDAALESYPRWGAYGTSKAALDHLGRIWAAELEGTGVRVLTVDPGEMDTAMHASAIPDADRATLAAPHAVAVRIVDLLTRAPLPASGTRLAIGRPADSGGER